MWCVCVCGPLILPAQPPRNGLVAAQGCGGMARRRRSQRRPGAAAVASSLVAVLTEIYLCGIYSCQEILRRNGRGQQRRLDKLQAAHDAQE
eukprot:COSAG01_NODE_53855_length_336_cov_0.831224_1_plen_90_part_10